MSGPTDLRSALSSKSSVDPGASRCAFASCPDTRPASIEDPPSEGHHAPVADWGDGHSIKNLSSRDAMQSHRGQDGRSINVRPSCQFIIYRCRGPIWLRERRVYLWFLRSDFGSMLGRRPRRRLNIKPKSLISEMSANLKGCPRVVNSRSVLTI